MFGFANSGCEMTPEKMGYTNLSYSNVRVSVDLVAVWRSSFLCSLAYVLGFLSLGGVMFEFADSVVKRPLKKWLHIFFA